MAIAFGASTTNVGTNSFSDSFSFSTSGSNRALIAIVATRRAAAIQVSHDSVTYNGVALTKAVEQADNGDAVKISLWYLAAPATGSNTLAVTTGGGGGSAPDMEVFVGYWTDVDQTTPVPTTTSANDGGVSATSKSTSITTVNSNSHVVSAVTVAADDTITHTETGLYSINTGGQTPDVASGGSYKVATSAGSHAMQESWTTSTGFAHILAEIKQAPQTLTSTITETVTATETVSNPAAYPSTITESMTVSEAVQQTNTEIITESMTLADVITATIVDVWTNVTKPTTSWTNESRTTTSWTNSNKPSSTWTMEPKSL